MEVVDDIWNGYQIKYDCNIDRRLRICSAMVISLV